MRVLIEQADLMTAGKPVTVRFESSDSKEVPE